MVNVNLPTAVIGEADIVSSVSASTVDKSIPINKFIIKMVKIQT